MGEPLHFVPCRLDGQMLLRPIGQRSLAVQRRPAVVDPRQHVAESDDIGEGCFSPANELSPASSVVPDDPTATATSVPRLRYMRCRWHRRFRLGWRQLAKVGLSNQRDIGKTDPSEPANRFYCDILCLQPVDSHNADQHGDRQ